MILVKKCTVGPIIGHTTPEGFRLWGRGAADCTGLARVESNNGQILLSLFPLFEHFDHTGIVDFGRLSKTSSQPPLTTGEHYRYQVGYVENALVPKVREILRQGGELDFSNCPAYTIVLPNNEAIEPVAPVRFVLGSCRDNAGKKGEPAFHALANLIEDPDKLRLDFLLMVGDQIYIDHTGKKWWDKEINSLEKYWREYRVAFSQPEFNRVIAQIPCYMIFDDHEVQNNWNYGKYLVHESKFHPYTMRNGLQAYQAYQANLSPSITDAGNLSPKSWTDKDHAPYWYKFSHGIADFFVMDVRGEAGVNDLRTGHGDLLRIGYNQQRELEAWLRENNGNVKFVVSAIPLLPDPKGLFSSAKDKWVIGLRQRHNIFEFIRKNQIRKVVFLSGDVHISYVAELTYVNNGHRDTDFRIYNVVSSAFNWATSPGYQNWHLSEGPQNRHARRGSDLWKEAAKYEARLLDLKLGKKKKKTLKRNNFSVLTVERYDECDKITIDIYAKKHLLIKAPWVKLRTTSIKLPHKADSD